jgi:hypothetical protein
MDASKGFHARGVRHSLTHNPERTDATVAERSHLTVVKMRRLSAVIAILALSRLSLGALIAGCPAATVAAMSQHAHSASPHGAEPAHDCNASCQNSGAGDGATQHGDCLAMSACITALASERGVDEARVPAASQPRLFAVERPLQPSRAPEPPPPRI